MTTLAAPARTLVAATALLVALALAPHALAQVPQPSLTVALAEPSVELDAATTTTLTGTVAYADTAPPVGGANDGTVTITLTPPAGWTATVEPASAFSLAPGEEAEFTLTLVAPALDAGAEDATGDLTVTASATSPGGRGADATATAALTAIAPPAPAPAPWYQTPGGIAAIVGAILLLAAGAAWYARHRRQTRLAAERAMEEAAARAAYMDRETGIAISLAGGPLQYGHRREVIYRLSIANTSKRPRVALVEVVDATNGWRAATQVTKLPLSPEETQTVTLAVTPDAVITPGDRATVVVRAKPEEAKERDERLTLEVVAPKSGVPTDPHYKIVTVQREGANNQVARR